MRDLLFAAIPNCTDAMCDKFVAYYDLLVERNKVMNLTAITAPEDVVKKHFLDSIAAAPLLQKGARVADVGTGAGFPAVPLLIVRPDLKVTLVDALNKRVGFLRELLDALGLQADCVHARAEDFARLPRARAAFDAVVSLAVASLPVLLEYTVPLLRVGGQSICYKGDAAAELESAKHALSALHCTAESVTVPADYGARSLIVCTKNAPTPPQYPRKAGLPAKQPL